MLKVNEQKVLADVKALIDKKSENLAKIEVDAKGYATAHGYDEEKTAKFVKFTQELQDNGLSAEETAKLELLSSYIDEVEEEVVEEELKLNVVPTTDGEVASSTVATVNHI